MALGEKRKFFAAFFWLISVGRNRDRNFYKKQDLEYYRTGIEINHPDIYHFISFNLIEYAYIDKEETFELLDKFLKKIETKKVDTLIFTLFENTAQYKEDFKHEIRTLFYSNIDKIDISSIVTNQLLMFLENAFGFEDLLSFIVTNINIKLKNNKYKFYDYGRNLYRNDKLSEEETIKRYIKVLNWYINNKTVKRETKEFIIHLFRPSPTVTPEIRNAVAAVIPIYKDDKETLLCLSKAIEAINSDAKDWVILMSLIAQEVLAVDKTIDVGKVFGSSYYANLGSKSKSGINVPYNEDVIKKNLLEKVLNENEFAPQVISYLQKCLYKVNIDIEREIERDKEESTW